MLRVTNCRAATDCHHRVDARLDSLSQRPLCQLRRYVLNHLVERPHDPRAQRCAQSRREGRAASPVHHEDPARFEEFDALGQSSRLAGAKEDSDRSLLMHEVVDGYAVHSQST